MRLRGIEAEGSQHSPQSSPEGEMSNKGRNCPPPPLKTAKDGIEGGFLQEEPKDSRSINPINSMGYEFQETQY